MDIVKLQGSVEIETRRAEASLKKIDAEATRLRDKLSRGGSFGVDSRSLSAITTEGLRARTVIEKIGEGATASLGKFRGSLALTGNSLKVVRETVESVSSEIVESFGVDGDVANLLANNLNKVSLSAIAMGGAVAGLVIGVGVLTSAMAGVGAEIKRTSDLTGLTIDQVQRFESAANAAGSKTDAFTDAIKDLRDRAKEATRGNLEIAQSFQALGVNAASAAQNAGPAFDRLLDVLSQVPDAQQRVTIAQRVLGDVNDDTLAGILALTDANGELRNRVNDLSVALDQQSVRELARLDQDWNLFSERLGVFSKRVGLGVVNTLEYIGLALAGETDQLERAGGASQAFASRQGAAAGPINSTTGAIQNQTSAVMQLSAELASVRLEGINTAVDQTIKQIAFNSRSATEALASFKREKLLNDDFFAGVNKLDQVKKNLEAIDEARNPKKRSSAGPRTTRGPLSELQQLQKQLAEINKDISSFQAFNSKEFGLRMDLEAGRAFKAQLDQIVTLRRALGEPIRTPFPATAGGAEKEIQRLNALKGVTELLAKSDPMAAIRESALASTQALSATFTELDRLVKDALPQTTELTTEQALAQNDLYRALLQTNPALAEYFRQQAQAADATIRATQATEAFRGLQESLNNQLQSFTALSSEQRTALELQGEAYRNLTDAQRAQLLDLARQVDAQGAYRRQVEESQRTMEQFADVTRGLFDTLFEQGPKKFFEQLLSTVKRTLARIASDIATSAIMKLFGFGGGGGPAAAGAGGRGGGLGSLFGGLLMGGAGGGGGFLTGGFAGGNPAAAAMGGGGGGGAMGGLIGNFLGSAKVGGFLSKIPILGKLFGGGAAAAAGGAGGGGAAGMAGLAGLFNNPITAVIAGGLIAAPFIAKLFKSLFGDKILKSLRGLIRGEYGLEVKSNSVLENVKALGESKFGKAFKDRQIETVRLPEVKDLLAEYAARTGQKGNSKLTSSSALRDEFDSRNQFTIPRREMGGPVIGGRAYLVGERRPEVFVPSTSGQILANVPQGGRGIVPTGGPDGKYLLEVLEELSFAVGRLRGVPAGQIVQMGLEERPGIAARDVRKAFDQRSEDANLIRERMEKR